MYVQSVCACACSGRAQVWAKEGGVCGVGGGVGVCVCVCVRACVRVAVCVSV